MKCHSDIPQNTDKSVGVQGLRVGSFAKRAMDLKCLEKNGKKVGFARLRPFF
jgi:hypothetical protein